MYQQQSNNAPIYNDILYYVAGDENGCSTDKNTFVKEALNGIVSDSIGLFISENLDNQITTTLPPCIDNIVNTLKLLENGKFGKVIAKFSGTNPIPLNFNWKIQLGPLTANNPASTAPSIQPGNTALTTLNEEYINISTDLSIAKTLIHECFHAYLVSVYKYKNIDKSYINLVNTYYSQFNNNLNDTHHHIFTLENMVEEIALALKEFGEIKGYTLPQQFYDDMAWGGLTGTSAFNDNLTDDDKDRILEVISSEYNNNNSPRGTIACP
ncbi:MAG: hypothetical protein IM568_04945 [Flavobacterium sp.]|nr:hypothetical protein [Flavobacterium sp.]